MPTTTFANPVLPGFHPDPSVCRVGGDFYLAVSSFEYFPGLPLFHSRDLIHWRPMGHALDRPGSVALDTAISSSGIFAPTIRYHDGRFYLITTDVRGIGNFVMSATDPAGPWSDPLPIPIDGIDPSLLFHEGRVWLTTSASGQAGILLAEVDLASGRLLDQPRLIWKGTGGKYPEGPHLYVRDGWFYLLISEGGTEPGHMITLARSRDIQGPYEACPCNPLLSHRSTDNVLQSTGHGDLVEDAAGRWWMVFLATRPIGYHGAHHLGRETCLVPVDWPAGEWPSVNGGRPLPKTLTVEAPHKQPELPAPEVSFGATLGTAWQFRRYPVADTWSLSRRPGALSLRCHPATLDDVSPLAFVGRRVQHFTFQAETRLDFVPQHPGEEAGLSVFMNERYHAECALVPRDGARVAILRQRFGRVVAELGAIPVPGVGPVGIRCTGEPGLVHIAVSYEGAWHVLGTVETRHLSTEIAGGFTGTYLGLYATGGGQNRDSWAAFDGFTYVPG